MEEIMNKTDLANTIYEWLKSNKETTTISIDGSNKKRSIIFIKIPCTKKELNEIYTIISGEITNIDDWCKTRNFSRVGYWLPKKEIMLEDKINSYNFFEVNYHYVNEEVLVLDFKKFAKKKVFDFYVRKYGYMK